MIVDANIVIKDFWFKGEFWTYLAKRNFLSHKLVISSIVLEEVAAHLEQRAEGLLFRISKSGMTDKLVSQYQRLFNRKKVGQESASALAKRYKKHILKFAKKIMEWLLNHQTCPWTIYSSAL